MSILIASTTRALGAILLAASIALPVCAEEPTAAAITTSADNAAAIDRDGKHICGYELMTDSERAGHRSMLYSTKSLEDRNAIRVEHCKRMQQRAAEQGVKLTE